MQVKPFQPDFSVEVSRVYALGWKHAYRGIVPEDYLDRLSLDHWEAYLKTVQQGGFMLMNHTQCVGICTVSKAREEQWKDWGELVSLYLLPDYMGKGFGLQLFSQAIAYLRKQGYHKIYLWVLEENPVARSFYERNGFVPTQERCSVTMDGTELMELRYISIFSNEKEEVNGTA